MRFHGRGKVSQYCDVCNLIPWALFRIWLGHPCVTKTITAFFIPSMDSIDAQVLPHMSLAMCDKIKSIIIHRKRGKTQKNRQLIPHYTNQYYLIFNSYLIFIKLTTSVQTNPLVTSIHLHSSNQSQEVHFFASFHIFN